VAMIPWSTLFVGRCDGSEENMTPNASEMHWNALGYIQTLCADTFSASFLELTLN
jgi:hypothetical protein